MDQRDLEKELLLSADPDPLVYQCPGETYKISHSIHLGRLAKFYPACQQCPHREETGSLSSELTQRLRDTYQSPGPVELFGHEGLEGVYGNELGTAEARQAAVAFGNYLIEQLALQQHAAAPKVALASDGRSATVEIFAAVCGGLRSTGCHVLDLGVATSPQVSFAVEHCASDGALYVGNPSCQPQRVGLKFWGLEGRPLSLDGSLEKSPALGKDGGLEKVRQLYALPCSPSMGRSGSLRRGTVEESYFAQQISAYRGVRSLSFVVEGGSQPLIKILARYCQSTFSQTTSGQLQLLHRYAADHQSLGEQIRRQQASLGMWIDGDGESVQLFDERGKPLAAESILAYLARDGLHKSPTATIVVEEQTSQTTVQALAACGAQIVYSRASRAEMDRAMRDNQAIFGGGPSGRFWIGGTRPAADAAALLATLLSALGQSERSLSQMLR